MKRWNLCSPVEYQQQGETKTKWLQLGVMFENKKGTGFNLILDALPVQEGSQLKIMAFPPIDDNKWGNKGKVEPLDDEISF
tara:strand:- start:3127 stop:3369 length:243 start_codon:yes stop_codon:yes gene_type:complete